MKNTLFLTIALFCFGIKVCTAQTAYVTSETANTITVINVATGTVIDTIFVGTSHPYGVSVSPDGTRVYVTTQVNNSVTVINTATNKVLDTIPAGTFPGGVVVSLDGTRVYVASQTDNKIYVINK